MQNLKTIIMSLKSHFKQIIINYKYNLFLFLIVFIILNLYNDQYYCDDMSMIIFRNEFYINFVFMATILIVAVISLTDDINKCFISMLNNNYHVREIFIGKLLAIYLFTIIIGLLLLASKINSFIYASLKFPMILPALLIVIFFHCTVIVLTTSLKNKTYFWFFIIILTIYAVYSSIPLLDRVLSKSLIHYIIFGEFSELEISYWIKEMYLPLHIIMSILLIYSVPYFIKNIESCE